MIRRRHVVLTGLALALSAATATADWRQLVPFGGRVEADPRKPYSLTEEHGPWLILASSFSGEGAEQQAHELVLELRRRYNLPAFVHRQNYDFTDPVVGLGVNKFGQPRKMKYRNDVEFTEIAVLIGHFDSIESPQATRALERVKQIRPETLDFRKRNASSQRFAGLRDLYRRVNPNEAKRSRGPMGSAFMTRNPKLPNEYFNPRGVDSLVAEMNRGVQYSLLKNPGRFTVKVATFRGNSSFDPTVAEQPLRKRGQPTKLEQAADQAHQMTLSLRQRGVEAFEFHDRYESMVTVGSFNQLTRRHPDGSEHVDPGVLAVMQSFGPQVAQLPNGLKGPQPRAERGIPFDIQPEPIEVPRTSIAADYARTSSSR